jgi:hypothetical protein
MVEGSSVGFKICQEKISGGFSLLKKTFRMS